MSVLQVANLAFESTDNNQITYVSNTFNLQVGGASNVFFANSTSTTLKVFSVTNNYSVTNGTFTFTGNVNALTATSNGQVVYSGNVSPTILSNTTPITDWDPGLSGSYLIRVSSASNPVQISGIVEGVNGQIIVLNNVGNNNVTLLDEDTINENTAARRFSLPDNIVIPPKSSLSLIYDGILARWRGHNTYEYPFFPSSTKTKGFALGGWPMATANTADRTTYSTETTAAVPGANLTQARGWGASAGNACKGFSYGGSGCFPTYGQTSTTDRTTYATETTAAVPGAAPALGKCSPGGMSNACKSFLAGGYRCLPTPTGTDYSSVDRTNFSTETTATVPGAALAQVLGAAGAVSNANRGYVLCATFACNITYDTEVRRTVSGAALTTSRYQYNSTTGCTNKGFFAGGALVSNSQNRVEYIDRLTYATEVTASVFSALSIGKYGVAGLSAPTKGFFSGGQTDGPTIVVIADADRLDYNTEVVSAVPGANLSVARRGVFGL